VALAVGPEIDYVKIEKLDESGEKIRFILAKDLLEKHFPKEENEYEIISQFKGQELVGKPYEALFDYYAKNENLENGENG
jgi:isoleucyl-tRNA synthetase